jgi:peptide/nickel transport system ATP-binding protein
MNAFANPQDAPLLSIEDLHVTFSTRRGLVEAVRGVTLHVAAGETLGIVGESGSGKSVTAFAVTRLLDASGRIAQGRVRFKGQDITSASSKQLRSLHGAAISMIFQNPRGALNPIRTVALQIADAVGAHERISPSEGRERALDLLKAVLIRDPEKRLDAYPHELSGGMCQRIMIAMAIASRPALLIADEPTTGLDVTTQKTVMDLLARITAERGMAMILITHDLGLAARYCDRVAVMQHGKVVEEAQPRGLFSAPRHDYTKRLVAASPTATSTIADLAPASLRGGAADEAIQRGGANPAGLLRSARNDGERVARRGSRRRLKAHQLACLVIVKLAGLGPLRRTHRPDEFRGLLGRIQRHRVFAGKYRGAHAGADRAGAEQVDAQLGAHGFVGPGTHQRVERSLGGCVGTLIGVRLAGCA